MISIPAVIGDCGRQRDQRCSRRKCDSMHDFHFAPSQSAKMRFLFRLPRRAGGLGGKALPKWQLSQATDSMMDLGGLRPIETLQFVEANSALGG